jgi:hypothetical protein
VIPHNLNRDRLSLSIALATGGLLDDAEIAVIVDAVGDCDTLDQATLNEAIARASASAAKRMSAMFREIGMQRAPKRRRELSNRRATTRRPVATQRFG